MKRFRLALLLYLIAPFASAATCRDLEFEGVSYTICDVTMTEDLRLFHSDVNDAPYGSFMAINDSLAESGQTLGFAMNAGMYHSDRAPVGLLILDGKQIAPIITSDGPGNFGLLPNGVFCITPDGFAVIESRAFKSAPPACTYATQSGPMLVIDGALHPKFLPTSDSTHIRNGVGISADRQTASFVISNAAVNFDSFARLFRDKLGLPNALYFDGSISRLYAPQLGRHDAGFPMGPIVGTVQPAGQ